MCRLLDLLPVFLYLKAGLVSSTCSRAGARFQLSMARVASALALSHMRGGSFMLHLPVSGSSSSSPPSTVAPLSSPAAGDVVAIWWEGDAVFYKGVVVSCDSDVIVVDYDDGSDTMSRINF